MITKVPEGDDFLKPCNHQLDRDTETPKVKANLNHLRMVLKRFRFSCDGIETLCINDLTLDNESAENIIESAFCDHARRNPDVDPDAKINLSLDSINYGIWLFKGYLNESAFQKKYLEDIAFEKEFMKSFSSNVVPPNDIGVNFDDIGALQNVKDELKELLTIPFKRPELSCKRKLTEVCKGILLYGPPGTGKTILAKAVAMEAGAYFINFSMSSIPPKWFGEADKYVKAVFSLASKKAPCVIFVDEVDRLLGQRRENLKGQQATQATLEIKNAFMKHWGLLLKKEKDCVLVLAVTNRPFDLEETVIGQFSHRLLVGLPDVQSRAQILRVILKYKVLSNDVDLDGVACMADGYSGSDLKNLCIKASLRPIMELYEKDKSERDAALAEGKVPPAPYVSSDVRALNMQDFSYSFEEVCSSVSSESVGMTELQQWIERYGEGGSRKRTRDSCFM
ncbi:outer mitochondrial transmembrane helix translocase [Raphanus sativus]|uniref:Outer mitochondrial transmembrane helix translocase n=1 Tax=Raphanus sativus TaxID=3726 RepID=A0A9W3DGX4_RAPSA|nr:outer mitochondrial transmembrane helix translocase [Raphanus sativus]